MTEAAEALERRIDELRAAVRRAVAGGNAERAKALRVELRRVEREWDDALEAMAERVEQADKAAPVRPSAPLLPLREQVHQALVLLGAPAAPKLIIAVHEAFQAGEMVPARLTSLRRDEERSFRSAPYARPYYLCSALTSDLLSPARGLLAVSTWPMERRIIGPLSPRVDFLTAAIRLAEHVERIPNPSPAAVRLLWRFAANIPDAALRADAMTPVNVATAAKAELDIHADADRVHREAAAKRAKKQLDDVKQLFGTQLREAGAVAE
ncbi:hypothetical protein AB0B66_08310 [Catellatospora sp. NPDC049111]|uniref:hypothetical protein n=1 Tax=Catellatospora sp. NPDC049111 TaxID=3155271 RepID=UPI0033CC02FF